MGRAPGFPSMTARKFRKNILEGRLGYRLVPGRGKGSHRHYSAEGRDTILFAYHDSVDLGGSEIRSILVNQAGLTIDEAKRVANGK